ncbi:TatD family hydrolase [bacterium]|nr:TatD family hydrolase [bacterium]
MFDVHAHLTDEVIYGDLDNVIKEAQTAGVRRFLIPAYSKNFWLRAKDIAEKYPFVYFAVGVHPLFIGEGDDQKLRETLVKHPKCLAIGEVGLDYVPDDSQKPRQTAWFAQEAAFAKEHDKPLVIHCRKAYYDLLEPLKEFGAPFLLHSCSCSREQVKPFLDLGAYISFSGTLTRTNAKKTIELARYVPRDKVLCETDSPYIGTDKVRPPFVRPAQVMEVAETYAKATGLTLEEAEKLTDKNAERFFVI